MKQLIITLALCTATTAKCYEALPIFAFYDFNKSFYNPAFTGAGKKITLTFIGNSWYYQPKYTWVSSINGWYDYRIANSPDYNYSANLDAQVFTKGKHSIGAGILFYHKTPSNNEKDYEAHNEARLNVSYGYKLGHSSVRAGISLSQMQDKLHVDIVSPFNNFNATGYSRNIGAGFVYSHSKHATYIGVSLNYLISRTLAKGNIIFQTYQPNFCFMTGTDIKLSKNWVGQPSLIVVRYGYAQVNFCVEYKKKLTLGTGYSIDRDYWPIILGYRVGRFSLQYANTTYISVSPNSFMPSSQHTIGLKYTIPQS